MSAEIQKDLIYASFFFIDIVGLSNPVLSTETQRTKVKILNETIYGCKTFQNYPKENILILPTGDGMLICFKNGLDESLNLAREFHEKLSNYNQKVTSVEKIETRIGCNIGHVFVVEDIYGNVNLWGPGAILARRVMDLGDSGHILVSNELANDLMEISDKYKEILHPLQNFGIKHGDNLLLYSAFGEGFGNPNTPKEKTKQNLELPAIKENFECKKIIFKIILKDKEKPTLFEREYYFANDLSEPINEFVTGMVSNSEEEFHSLHLKIFDESNKKLEVSKILASTPLMKKIIIKLTNPIFPGENNRSIKLVYESILSRNVFENFFLMDTNNFELTFSHFSNLNYTPTLFYFNNNEGTKNLINLSSKITKGVFTNHKWEHDKGINIKDIIHLEW